MPLPKTAKVVVIGGGVFGTSAAFHLAEAGHKDVVLIEKGAIAAGTTPYAAGQTGYLNCDEYALKFGTYCIEFFEHFQERTGRAIDFRQVGSVRIALTEQYQADIEGRAAAAKRLGHDVEFLTPARARELVPNLVPPDDCRMLFIPRDGYAEPKSIAVAYALAAQDHGVSLHTRVNALGIEVTNGRVSGVRTAEGIIETDWVVLAAGAWARQFGQSLGLNLRTVPVRHQAFVTGALPNIPSTQPIVRFTEPQLYVRPEAGGLLVGGYGYRPLSFDMNSFPPGFEIASLEADPIYYQQLRDQTSKFFPVLKDAFIVQERRGLPTISPDGKLLVSESSELPGLIVASACGVGGIDRSPGMGRLVADIVGGGEPWIDPARLNIDRFGDRFASDAALRSQCEEVYAHHYHQVY